MENDWGDWLGIVIQYSYKSIGTIYLLLMLVSDTAKNSKWYFMPSDDNCLFFVSWTNCVGCMRLHQHRIVNGEPMTCTQPFQCYLFTECLTKNFEWGENLISSQLSYNTIDYMHWSQQLIDVSRVLIRIESGWIMICRVPDIIIGSVISTLDVHWNLVVNIW